MPASLIFTRLHIISGSFSDISAILSDQDGALDGITESGMFTR